MSDPAPQGVDLPFVFVFEESGVPMTGAETVLVRSVTRASDGTEVLAAADAATTFDRHGQFRYLLPGAESDRYRETYVAAAEMTTGSPDRAWAYAKATVDQGLYVARRQLPADALIDKRGRELAVYLWHTWGGPEEGLIEVGKDLSGFDNFILSFKDDPESDDDAASVLELDFAAGSGTGLLVLNGAAYGTASHGVLALASDNLGITFTVNNTAIATVSGALSTRRVRYQLTGVIDSPESREVLREGSVDIRAGSSRGV